MNCELNGPTGLASRISGAWNAIFTLNGWQDYGVSSTEFSQIWYNYTSDAPFEVTLFGENLWKELLKYFGGDDELGQLRISRADLSTITRRSELWDK